MQSDDVAQALACRGELQFALRDFIVPPDQRLVQWFSGERAAANVSSTWPPRSYETGGGLPAEAGSGTLKRAPLGSYWIEK